MPELEPLSRGQDYLGNIARMLGDLQGVSTVIHELIQNADDAPGATRMRFTVTADRLEVWNDGVFEKCDDVTTSECGWIDTRGHRCDFHSFRTIGSGDKRDRPGTTGAFGIGFTAVYQLTDRPELLSNGEHWVVDEMAPHDGRIGRDPKGTENEGTTFLLPWAVQPSAFREAVRQDPVTQEEIADFSQQLRDRVPMAMPFLKQLRSIEVVDADESVRFELRRDGSTLELVSSTGPTRRWHLLCGEFDDTAAELKESHTSIEEERASNVSIALPLDEPPASGLLYATLPTEESSHLPLLVNADFFPASDRKRIKLDEQGAESEWNRAAIQAAADVLAANLNDLPAVIGDAHVVALLLAARELADPGSSIASDGIFAEFWLYLLAHLPTAHLVPLEGGGYETTRHARLWNEAAELEAMPLLRSLGIGLVAQPVKDDWYKLRSTAVGIENLHLKHLVAGMSMHRMRAPWRAQVGEISASDMPVLWGALEVLLTIGDRSNQDSRAKLGSCAVAPSADGWMRALNDVARVDGATHALFEAVGADAPLLDETALGVERNHLLEQVPLAAFDEVLTWLEAALAKGSASDQEHRLVLDWLFEHRDEIDGEEIGRVAALPVFPTASGIRALTGLALPGDFRDELGLATIVQLDGITEMQPFLEKLGARRLSLATYCTDFLAVAIADGDLSPVKLDKGVRLVATRLSEIRDDSAVKESLAPLPLVACTDGVWRPGYEVYLRNDLTVLVGPDVPVAVIPSMDRSAHEDLFEWLGAATEPRALDLVARCRYLASGPPDHRQSAEAIVDYAAKQFASRPDGVKVDLAELRQIRWLPTGEDRSRGYPPAEVYLRFRRNLFASQARFLDIGVRTERDSAEFLRWLGLGEEPEPGQVVAHLLKSAADGTPVGEDMWLYLNDHAADPALDALLGTPCLLLQESRRYVTPQEVYWGPHPFGRRRHQLAQSFGKHRALLDRLEVAEAPSPQDAVNVLLDIAADHWGEEAPLFEEDVLIVRACWRLLSQALADSMVDTDALDELRNAEVVLDAEEWLRQPKDLYFRDSVTLANRFPTEVQQRLIDRPEGLWPALAQAGVSNLSDAVTTHIVEQVLLEPGGILDERMWGDRRRLVERVLSHDDDTAASRLDDLEASLPLLRLGNLQIRHTIEVDGVDLVSDPFQRSALFLRDEDPQLLWVDGGPSATNWLEVGRELVRALGIDGEDAPGIAAVLRGVLAAPSAELASAELDELGYPALDTWDEAQAEPGVSSGLGGTADTDTGTGSRDEAPMGLPEHPSPGGEDPTTDPGAEADHPGADDEGDGPEGGGADAFEGGGTGTGGKATGGEPGQGGAGGAAGTSRQSKLRSYVLPAGAPDPAGEGTDTVDDVDRHAVQAVLDYEREHGRDPTEQPHDNPGYDVRSESPSGEVRYIEVKGTAAPWGEQGVALSSRQYLEGTQRREDFWLYVVDRALGERRVHPIQDPVSQIDQYLFDDGWRVVSERADVERPALPRLQLPAAPGGMAGPVAFRADATDSEPAGWISCEHAEHADDWFAVRITGEALGLKYRGGLAVVRPLLREPEDDDRVLVELIGRVDPDTESQFTIRLWMTDVDDAGSLLRVRLLSESNVSPISIEDRDQVRVLGEVVALMDDVDLATLGYLPTDASDVG